ncbi:hypothetical protein GGTG_12126 [Gaeumannomyces tritici R3-111a-1]|uniref:Uncharacterized protein n=1 Tax=Gaeumannomyces tritici (strain R3-111a-1) TaxID=644352 RepID=J3PF47_GAET3|nr:hypothetical protein GGTG_12126 [Gaeumannomyces tritici R3-111a-1]EJT71105.1 hypothetical protein GGTG_12126 [Gaeumannomyces tritici R3-111a-1]
MDAGLGPARWLLVDVDELGQSGVLRAPSMLASTVAYQIIWSAMWRIELRSSVSVSCASHSSPEKMASPQRGRSSLIHWWHSANALHLLAVGRVSHGPGGDSLASLVADSTWGAEDTAPTDWCSTPVQKRHGTIRLVPAPKSIARQAPLDWCPPHKLNAHPWHDWCLNLPAFHLVKCKKLRGAVVSHQAGPARTTVLYYPRCFPMLITLIYKVTSLIPRIVRSLARPFLFAPVNKQIQA